MLEVRRGFHDDELFVAFHAAGGLADSADRDALGEGHAHAGGDNNIARAGQMVGGQVVHTAQKWLGTKEEDGSHREIIDRYNAHIPLPRSYAVSYEDAWCAVFESVVAMECGLTDIIPPECGCDPQIALFQNLGCWEEADDYVPLPGDLIYYHWDCEKLGDCTCVTDHVGIVVATAGRFVKVIEGNKDNDVSYRYIQVDAPDIRGYGVPNYGG